jgi:glycosyltransferase involved in cell wall biosynthesis
LSVAYPLAAVSADSVGGAEQILSALDRAITAAGHTSFVVAPAGSTCAGELLPTAPAIGPFDWAAIHRCHESCRRQIARALEHERIDVVHMHGVDFPNYVPKHADVPILATLHLWPAAYPASIFTSLPQNVHLQCVSEPQQRACPPGARTFVIRNGIDTAAFFAAPVRSNIALVLGRVCPEKGVHVAIDAARAAGLPIVIAGSVFPYPAHQQYFDREIVPRLGAGVRFIGPVTGRAKRELLAAARCLVLASVVPETSSLGAMEALASGAPVVALRSPALEELIEDGRTGWLVGSAGELARALTRVDTLSSEACRAAARARCSIDRMASEYLAAYERLARHEHPRAPAVNASVHADVLARAADLERRKARGGAAPVAAPP